MASYGKFNGQYFSQNDFKSGAQIWSGSQDNNGSIFFGNNDGLLVFNGVNWKLVNCDSTHSGVKAVQAVHKTKVSKVFTSKSGKVYVGRKDNFGEIQYSKKGETVYHPLFISKKENELGQVWNIFEFGRTTFFIGEKKIFQYDGKKLKMVRIPDVEKFTCKTAARIEEGILLAYRNDDPNINERKYIYYNTKTGSSYELQLPAEVTYLSISGSHKIDNTWHLFNLNGDVYKVRVKNNRISWLKTSGAYFSILKDKVVNAVKYHHNHFYVSTEDGVLILDRTGRLVRKFDLNDGMENLSVYDVILDNENNLWLCQDNGIHFFETSSPITYYDKSSGLIDFISRFNIIDDKPYLATASDIWTPAIENNRRNFRSLMLLNQQVFDINTYETDFGRKTIAIGFNGVFEVDVKTAYSKRISEEYAWITHQNPLNKNEIFVGLETGLGKLILTAKGWEYETLISDLNGDIISLTTHKGKLIFGAANKGVFVYDIRSGKHEKVKSPSGKNINTQYVVERFQGRVYVGMETGMYYLSDDFKTMIPFREVNRKFIGDSHLQIHRIINQDDTKLWVMVHLEKGEKEFEHGWLEVKNGKWVWTSWPFEQISLNKDPLAFDIAKISNKEIWFCAGSSIFSYNPESIRNFRTRFTLSFDELIINKKLKVYDPLKAEPLGQLDYANNSMKFVFHANSFMGLRQMKYRYRLDDYMDEWSEWSELNFADFNKIGEGTYTLKVQARNIYGFESEVLEFSFTILPPWYRTWWAFTIYAITFFILIYITIRLSIQRVKNQNIRLEAIVKERTSEIAQQNHQLEIQKEEIQQKTQDIVDSIVYAKRIQETILPSERLDRMFDEYFVFYRPKDIVSGDFYWARQKGNLAIFSAIDCTGHGVPGALVSIVGNASLLRCVNEHRLTEPAEILNMHREIVVKSFGSKGNTDVKDGMDMSLCVLDQETLVMKYSGANNECVIIRNKEIIELKPDKQPIGQFSHATPFTQHEIQLQSGDCVYQFTDGYVDQFGGEKGKKLKSRPFKEMLVQISHLPMKEQDKKVREFFDSWKGEFEQVDDVCVFGVKI
ncbi:MAG: SpoIIE family protein phosphatase [Bacteroidota bacterium]